MTQVNIYKIAEEKISDFTEHIKSIYSELGETHTENYKRIKDNNKEILEIKYDISLYFAEADSSKDLKWNWVLKLFDEKPKTVAGTPKGLLIFSENQNMYAVTFGHSYFQVDPFSDKDWAFDFARRLEYLNVKTTSLTTPNSLRSKTINTYLDSYGDIEFDSGEALTKLKAKIKLPDEFTLFSDTIEFGNSIRFSNNTINLKKFVDIIEYVNHIIATKNERVKIPYFKKIKDDDKKAIFLDLLKKSIRDDLYSIDFSEYQVCGTNIIFKNDDEFSYKYGRNSMPCDNINHDTLLEFMNQYNIDKEHLLDIKIVASEDSKTKYEKNISKIIYYTDDTERVLLSDGFWYEYNDDYLGYLNDSILQLNIEYDPKYNYSKEKHQKFLEEKFKEAKTSEGDRKLSDEEIVEELRKKYYREFYFNKLQESEYGYTLYDRGIKQIGPHKIEVMDLYKDETMYSVKFGKASSELSYAVDQSLEAAKLYRKNQISVDGIPIKTVCIWLILDRSELPLNSEEKPDLTNLDMLILKNRLDQWRKEILLLGYAPIIRINYVKA